MRFGKTLMLAAALVLTAACGSNDDDDNATGALGDAASADTSSSDGTDGTDGTGTDGSDEGAIVEEPRNCTWEAAPARDYTAEIKWTSYGIPHISGSDIGNAAYGMGYAMARDHICIIADQAVAVRSERAMYFGPGDEDANIQTDLGYKALRIYEDAQCTFDELTPAIKERLAGFAAGVNKYVDETGLANLPPECKDADWVKPLTQIDVHAASMRLALRGSGLALLSGIVTVTPPGASKPAPTTPWPKLDNGGLGSNGWAIGKDRSDNARGKVVANPHFPWEGELRLWEHHMTVPGVLDVYGATLVGAPITLIGFNKDVAWTHTVANSDHFTGYRLTVNPNNHESYLYDGEVRRMTKRTHTIKVKQADGTLVDRSQVFFRSHYGPMIAIGPVGWTDKLAITYRDANVANHRIWGQWVAMSKATSVADIRSSMTEQHGIPWVNTIAADKDGSAMYTDACLVPNLSQETQDDWWAKANGGDSLVGLAYANGFVLLGGDGAADEWVEGTDYWKGRVPYADSPMLERSDYALNANDSHWLSHATATLDGYSRLFGSEKTKRSARTVQNLVMAEPGPLGASGDDGKFTSAELESMLIGDNRQMYSERLRDAVVDRCTTTSSIDIDGTTVDLTDACAVLRDWDGRVNITSKGAHVWRSLWSLYELSSAPTQWKFLFDPADPVATPHTLSDAPTDGPDPVLVHLAGAIALLDTAGIALDAELGSIQFTKKGADSYPVPGGMGWMGTFSPVLFTTSALSNSTLLPAMSRGEVLDEATDLTDEGYAMNYGSSFQAVMEFTDDGPQARAILTYSQASSSDSPHSADQTAIVDEQALRPVLFTSQDIDDDNPTTITISSK
ncbi:MAG: acyl-homoserine-lactone acylase [Myxococcota bacterium]|jgi:acyl-homoserine-lactone acylase